MGLGGISPASAEAHSVATTEVREVWTYPNGRFENTAGTMWKETQIIGLIFNFQEVTRNSDYVELLDRARPIVGDVRVRLYSTECHVRIGNGPWVLPYQGQWQQ